MEQPPLRKATPRPIDPPLLEPTRAKRVAAKKGVPYKWYLIGGAVFGLFFMAVLVAGTYFGLQKLKDFGYDSALAQRYPQLAGFVLAIKNTDVAEDIVVDSKNGVVTYRDKRLGRRFKVQEVNGTLKRELLPIRQGDAPGSNDDPTLVKVDPKKGFRADPDFKKRFPLLASEIVSLQQSDVVENLRVDRDRGIVYYKDTRFKKDVRLQETDGEISREWADFFENMSPENPNGDDEPPDPGKGGKKKKNNDAQF